MNIKEYKKVKDFTYREYCDYLQKKYGIGRSDYMTKSWNKNGKISRTKEGLIAHHKYEDCAIMLSTKQYAMRNPFEWQLAENIVYCDDLEHLFLHILICEYPRVEQEETIGYVVALCAPALRDAYNVWITEPSWQERFWAAVAKNRDTYIALLTRFKQNCKNYPYYTEFCALT